MSNEASKEPHSAKDSATYEVLSFLKSLHKYSKDSWTSREESLWVSYLKMLRQAELVALKSRGLDDKNVEKLVEWVWVSWNPKSSALIVDRAPPDSTLSFAPAIRVFRNGSLVIHPDVRGHLNSHPMLAVPDGDESAKSHDQPLILQAIDKVEEDLDLGHISLGHVSPTIPEDAGHDRRIVDCGDAVHQLKVLLDTKYLKKIPDEEIEWLEAAKNSERFWRILDTAFLLGEFLEHHRILDGLDAEEVMLRRITRPPGKGAIIEGPVVRMIEEYALENKSLPSPGMLLKWLGGEKPHNGGKSLQVNHPLWTVEMQSITWAQFQDRVKKALQKMKRSGGRDDDSNMA
jgi:hypothetical protein